MPISYLTNNQCGLKIFRRKTVTPAFLKFFLDDDKSYWVVKNVTACPSSIRLFAQFC